MLYYLAGDLTLVVPDDLLHMLRELRNISVKELHSSMKPSPFLVEGHLLPGLSARHTAVRTRSRSNIHGAPTTHPPPSFLTKEPPPIHRLSDTCTATTLAPASTQSQRCLRCCQQSQEGRPGRRGSWPGAASGEFARMFFSWLSAETDSESVRAGNSSSLRRGGNADACFPAPLTRSKNRCVLL